MTTIQRGREHAAYIAAVADALTAAGFEVLDRHADANDPRDGAIQIRPVGDWADYAEVWIGWQEERRWCAVPYAPKGGPLEAVMVADLTYQGAPIATVASPATVAEAVADLLDMPWNATLMDDHPDVDFPGHEADEDNPELEAALARYSSP